MNDTWWNHNTDKLLLFFLVLLLAYLNIHVMHHDQGDMQAVTWAQGAFSTVLGALILILTGRVAAAHPSAPGLPPTAEPGSPAPTLPIPEQK